MAPSDEVLYGCCQGRGAQTGIPGTTTYQVRRSWRYIAAIGREPLWHGEMLVAGDAPLPPGLYELLLTETLRHRLPDGRSDLAELSDDADGILTRYVAEAVQRTLRSPGMDLRAAVELCNDLLREMAARAPAAVVLPADGIPFPAELLTAIRAADAGLAAPTSLPRPETPLSDDALFVNAPHEPSLAGELRTEILSADRIDLLCAFIVWSGIRIVRDELKEARARGVPVRVITTTYTGTTEPRALDELRRIGAEIKVSYDTRMTRLHAKAWLFERNSGFSTAYIGSSNLTHSALHDGLEWNVRLSQMHSPELLDRFRAAFETYWADDHIVPYERDQFVQAIGRARSDTGIDYTPFDIRPFEYQRTMLDALQAERERHGRWRNLVVAATGTGKTVVAAFDYRRMAAAWGGASLLFVAHRQEILEQSRTLFRHVLRNGSFGELLVGGKRPVEGKHVFASVQSLSVIDLASIPPDMFDIVIIDEFHHAEAPTYRRLLDHLRPRLLLGLTATPERADSRDILHRFEGSVAVELRLWDALDQGLLAPFQYFGIADGVDLSQLEWKRSGYDVAALDAIYTANDMRTAKIVAAVNDVIGDWREMRALGFCVSVSHAEYMARSFTRAGIPSRVVVGVSNAEDRARAVEELRRRRINVIFTVDLFNEGIDIPEVDTVLLLRPTESATVFLQQLGRGLRLAPDKSGLTVLDFIGQQRREFRFDARFQALTGVPARKLRDAIEHDFPYLPSGCAIHLDRVAAEIVLDNLRSALGARRETLIRELRALGDPSLAEFLRETGRTLDEIYRGNRPGWMALRREAGLAAPPHIDGDDALVRAIGRMGHIGDDERLRSYTAWLGADSPPNVETLSPRETRLLTMLHFDLWTRKETSTSARDAFARLWGHSGVRQELVEVLDVLADSTETLPLEDRTTQEPLAVHAYYTRDEVLSALGVATVERPPTMREGVLWAPDPGADVFFITLQKTESRFSPTTMYRDYAISPKLFHWESQSTTSVSSPTGQRYIHHRARGSRVLLFAREVSDQRAFLYLGPARYVRHVGDRPIAITWQLEHEIPAAFFLQARAAS